MKDIEELSSLVAQNAGVTSEYYVVDSPIAVRDDEIVIGVLDKNLLRLHGLSQKYARDAEQYFKAYQDKMTAGADKITTGEMSDYYLHLKKCEMLFRCAFGLALEEKFKCYGKSTQLRKGFVVVLQKSTVCSAATIQVQSAMN